MGPFHFCREREMVLPAARCFEGKNTVPEFSGIPGFQVLTFICRKSCEIFALLRV